MTRPIGLLAALLAAVLLASACTTDDPKPNYSSVSTTPTSASPSPSDSPSPTGLPTTGPNVNQGEVAPNEPASAKDNNSDGAQAFETYYIKMIDWTYATSSPGILKSFYAPECTNCMNFLSNLSKQTADGSTFRGSRISIKRLALVTNDQRAGSAFAVSVEISATALKILDSSGQVTNQGAASTLTLTNWLRWSGSAWIIVDQGKA